MSTNLHWAPKPTSTNTTLSTELKRAISRRLWDTDGSCGDGKATVGHKDLPYIEALRDMDIEDADLLIDLIETHDEIELWHGD